MAAVVLTAPMGPGERILRTELVLDASVAEVWRAWTTEEGIRSFFAPGGRVDLKVDGAYEVFFFPTAPAGRRGAEGQRILLLEPDRRFSFTWDAPPDQPYVRAQRTQVVLDLEPIGPERTRLRFTHRGWGDGPEWDRAYDYFDDAWRSVVLPRLKHRLAHGPIDWAAPPRLEPVASSLRAELIERR
jgi:uncharacterized protein YndB with AHSA1/START domain